MEQCALWSWKESNILPIVLLWKQRIPISFWKSLLLQWKNLPHFYYLLFLWLFRLRICSISRIHFATHLGFMGRAISFKKVPKQDWKVILTSFESKVKRKPKQNSKTNALKWEKLMTLELVVNRYLILWGKMAHMSRILLQWLL